MTTVVLLGPQRFEPSLAQAAEAIGVRGQIALCTAGWQEREPEDEELAEHLGGGTVNLLLHRRAEDVFRRDPELSEAYRARQLRYRQLQDFYRIRLEYLIETARVITHRNAPDELLEEEQAASVNAIRMLDRHHKRRCERVRREFRERWDPSSRPVIAKHCAELKELLADCVALAIAGGNVATLINRLQLFDIAELIEDRPVLAWSAGAMAVTENVVVFHDDPPQGIDAPQVLDVGLGLVRDVVALPCPEGRLATDDPERMAMYARRFAPARCVVLPRRAWIVTEGEPCGRGEGTLTIAPDGALHPAEVAA